MSKTFRHRSDYINNSFMLSVGRYNGKHREKLSFMELAATVNQMLDESPSPLKKNDCIAAGSQNPFALAEIDNVAAKIAGVLSISGVKSLLFEAASSSGATAFESACLDIASGRHDHVQVIGIQSMSRVEASEATLLIISVPAGENEYRFLTAVDPAAKRTLVKLNP